MLRSGRIRYQVGYEPVTLEACTILHEPLDSPLACAHCGRPLVMLVLPRIRRVCCPPPFGSQRGTLPQLGWTSPSLPDVSGHSSTLSPSPKRAGANLAEGSPLS